MYNEVLLKELVSLGFKKNFNITILSPGNNPVIRSKYKTKVFPFINKSVDIEPVNIDNEHFIPTFPISADGATTQEFVTKLINQVESYLDNISSLEEANTYTNKTLFIRDVSGPHTSIHRDDTNYFGWVELGICMYK